MVMLTNNLQVDFSDSDSDSEFLLKTCCCCFAVCFGNSFFGIFQFATNYKRLPCLGCAGCPVSWPSVLFFALDFIIPHTTHKILAWIGSRKATRLFLPVRPHSPLMRSFEMWETDTRLSAAVFLQAHSAVSKHSNLTSSWAFEDGGVEAPPAVRLPLPFQ